MNKKQTEKAIELADAPGKGGVADLKKARHYLDRMIESVESPPCGFVTVIPDSPKSA